MNEDTFWNSGKCQIQRFCLSHHYMLNILYTRPEQFAIENWDGCDLSASWWPEVIFPKKSLMNNVNHFQTQIA